MRFAVHRPGIPEASPRSPGVPRRDVPGRIHVRVAGETAGSAHQARLALTRLRIHVPARRAALARERGSDLLHPAGRLVLQPAHQQAPPRPQDPPVQPGLLPDVAARITPDAFRGPGHVLDLQVFDADHVEPPRDARGDLLGPVLAPVGLAGLQPGDRVLDPAAAVRSPPSAGERALQPPQPDPLPRGQAGAVQQLAGGQRCGDRHPPVNAHRFAVTGCGNRPGDRGEGDVPPARPVHRHPVGLHVRRHRAGPAEPHPPGLQHPDQADLTGHTAHVPLPAAPPGDPESLIPPGLAPRRPPGRVRRVEERRHRPGEVAQRLLLHGLGAGGQPRVLGPRLGELPALLRVARRARPARAPVGVLLDGQVPDVPGVAAVVPQHGLLGGGGEQPVPGHANTVSDGTDISGEVTRRFFPGLKAGVSMPRF